MKFANATSLNIRGSVAEGSAVLFPPPTTPSWMCFSTERCSRRGTTRIVPLIRVVPVIVSVRGFSIQSAAGRVKTPQVATRY
jgi:hypothetical protein